MDALLEAAAGLVCAALGVGLLLLMFGKRVNFVEGHRLPWWGVRKNANGQIEVHEELVMLLGLLIVFAGFGLWVIWKKY